MKTASFHVRASTAQAERWNRASQAEGFVSAGQWLGHAADAYLRVRARAGIPLPLARRHGHFRAWTTARSRSCEDGSPPLRDLPRERGGPGQHGCHVYTLAYLPALRVVATFRYAKHGRALAAELAGVWARRGGEETDIRAGAIVERHQREAK